MKNDIGLQLDKTAPIPLYLQFKSILEEMIEKRREEKISFIPKEEDLCKAFEVSRDTVAKAISLLVKEGVLHRIKRKGTFINRDNKKTASNKNCIGILLPLGGLYYPYLKRMCEKIWAHGYETIVFEYSGIRDETKLFKELTKSCDGIIFNPDGDGHALELIKEAKSKKCKIVLLDIYYPEIETGYVCSDNFAASFTATEHLIKNGRKKIAFVTNSMIPSSLQERFNGYSEALCKNKIQFKEDFKLVLHHSMDELYFMLQVPFSLLQIMKDFIISKRPDAMLFAAHLHVFIALKAMQELNLRAPDDIALAVFDNFLVAEFLSPPLTAIEQPLEQIASESINMLINLIKGNLKEPLHLKFPANLIIRESSGRHLK
jgi:DNA-binding LacI/PurR family transcriptional regulator